MVAHEIVLQGPGFLGPKERPALLQRTDPDFIAALLNELRTEEGRARLRNESKANRYVDGVLRLYQPVQRVFHLVVVDASCLVPGNPRLDPRRIESAGFVLRRIGDDGRPEGWLKGETGPAGWVGLAPAAETAEPEAERRLAQAHPVLLAVRGRPSPLSEQVTRLFVAPPDICQSTGRTLLYGVLSLASSEVSAAPQQVSFTPEEAAELVPQWLQRYEGARPRLPYAGERLGARHARVRGADMDLWLEFLRQLQVVFDVFEGTGDIHNRFRAALNEIPLVFADGISRNTALWLDDAVRILLDGETSIERKTQPQGVSGKQAGFIEIPVEWPRLSTDLSNRFKALCLEAVQARLAVVVPGRPRFDDSEARYELRAFARVRHDDNCPPKLVWSNVSERFTIAMWYENGPMPPVLVQLPDILSPSKIKQLKPNVAFQVPRDLFAFLRKNTPEDILAGAAKKGGGGGLGMICGFNIPIITICAFIVLYIILNLLNIVFRWLPYILICIPFPKKLPASPPPNGGS